MFRYELAGDRHPEDWNLLARSMLPVQGDWIEFQDRAAGRYRTACVFRGRLAACFFATESGELPEDSWLATLFSREILDSNDRCSVLAGRPARSVPAAGKVICACFSVGVNTIASTVREQRLTTVEEIGQALKAGTNCGSCVPELDAILRASREVA